MSKDAVIRMSVLVAAIFAGLWIGFYLPYSRKIAACETAVKARLASPASAKFSEETFDKQVTVKLKVDSQNNFGAMMRSEATCFVVDDMPAEVAELKQLR